MNRAQLHGRVGPGDLLVPWALDSNGRLVAASDAQRGLEYRCPNPACAAPLHVREGPKRVRHLAHRPRAGCSGETVLHWAAKRRLAEVVFDWVQGGRVPRIQRLCPDCGKRKKQPLPQSVCRAEVEVELGGVRPDVVLLDAQGEAIAAVEVFVTHAVGEHKAVRISLPWVELHAEAILKRPFVWVPRQAGNLRPLKCDHVPPYRRRVPGEYFVAIVGENDSGSQRYASWPLARATIAGYVGRVYPGRTMRVVVDVAEGRYLGTCDGRRWTTPLALVDRRSP